MFPEALIEKKDETTLVQVPCTNIDDPLCSVSLEFTFDVDETLSVRVSSAEIPEFVSVLQKLLNEEVSKTKCMFLSYLKARELLDAYDRAKGVDYFLTERKRQLSEEVKNERLEAMEKVHNLASDEEESGVKAWLTSRQNLQANEPSFDSKTKDLLLIHLLQILAFRSADASLPENLETIHNVFSPLFSEEHAELLKNPIKFAEVMETSSLIPLIEKLPISKIRSETHLPVGRRRAPKKKASDVDVAGNRLETDFEEVELLGGGSFGRVVMARNRLDGMYYAIKCIELDLSNAERTKQTLVETQALAKISHEHVVSFKTCWIQQTGLAESESEETPSEDHRSVDDAATIKLHSVSIFIDDHEPVKPQYRVIPGASEHHELSQTTPEKDPGTKAFLYIQMEYCRQNTLAHFLENGSIRQTGVIWKIVRGIFEGLACIHSHGITHRDLKPSNIFLAEDYQVRIGDFGLALVGREDKDLKKTFFSSSSRRKRHKISRRPTKFVGTMLYAAENQPSDIFSLGLIIYELFYGFSSKRERNQAFAELRATRQVDAQFKEKNVRQSVLIEYLLSDSPPTAKEVLESDDLLRFPEGSGLTALERLMVSAKRNKKLFSEIVDIVFRHRPLGSHTDTEIKRFTRTEMTSLETLISEEESYKRTKKSCLEADLVFSHRSLIERRRAIINSTISSIFQSHCCMLTSTSLIIPPTDYADKHEVLDASGVFYELRNKCFESQIDPNFNGILRQYAFNPLYHRKKIGNSIKSIEIQNCQMEIIGIDSPKAESELLTVVNQLMTVFPDIEVCRTRLNHRWVFEGVLLLIDGESCLHNENSLGLFRSAVRKNKFGDLLQYCREQLQGNSVKLDLVRRFGQHSDILPIDQSIDELQSFFEAAHSLNEDERYVKAIQGLDELRKIHALYACLETRQSLYFDPLLPPYKECLGLFFESFAKFSKSDFDYQLCAANRRASSVCRLSINLSVLYEFVRIKAEALFPAVACVIAPSNPQPSAATHMEMMRAAIRLWASNIRCDIFYPSPEDYDCVQKATEFGIQVNSGCVVVFSDDVEGDYQIILKSIHGCRDSKILRSALIQQFVT